MIFWYISHDQEHQQGWYVVGFHMMAGWAGGAAARLALAARPEIFPQYVMVRNAAGVIPGRGGLIIGGH